MIIVGAIGVSIIALVFDYFLSRLELFFARKSTGGENNQLSS